MLNLTPHPIVLRADGIDYTIQPSGTVARVATAEVSAAATHAVPTRDAEIAAALGVPGGVLIEDAAREIAAAIPVIRRTLGQVEGLPAERVPCIVSALVAAAVPGRAGVYSPDTGATAIRDAEGRIVAVTRLIAA